ncbi:hypothetical protein BaRGS_00040320 [Batillaria attramentaria]|uniref:Secreted protein n=1 Tax=Batillaria attramentaria TaxID=370345 RepID=A0ABD0J115_9CAEN
MERVNGAVRVTHAGVGIVCVSRLRLCCFLRWDLTRTQNKNEINVREGGTRQKKRKKDHSLLVLAARVSSVRVRGD